MNDIRENLKGIFEQTAAQQAVQTAKQAATPTTPVVPTEPATAPKPQTPVEPPPEQPKSLSDEELAADQKAIEQARTAIEDLKKKYTTLGATYPERLKAIEAAEQALAAARDAGA